jgi:hypothetical protein
MRHSMLVIQILLDNLISSKIRLCPLAHHLDSPFSNHSISHPDQSILTHLSYSMENIEPFPKEGNATLAKRSYYKPWALKTPALVMLLLLTLSLLGMTEFALHALPASSSHGTIEGRTVGGSLPKRQSDNFTVTVTTRYVMSSL